MARALALVLFMAVPAHAQVAGTADDPLRELQLRPEVTTSWFAPFAVRGLEPIAYVDGFEVPTLQHDFLGRGVDGSTLTTDAGVGFAGPNVLTLDAQLNEPPRLTPSVTVRDLGLATQNGHGRILYPATWFDSAVSEPEYYEAHGHVETSRRRRWQLFETAFASHDGVRIDDVYRSQVTLRATAGGSYRGRIWNARAAASMLFAGGRLSNRDASHVLDSDHRSIDGRVDVTGTFRNVAGVEHLLWHSGAAINDGRYTLDGAWSTLPRDGSPVPAWPSPASTFEVDTTHTRTDVALWSSLAAQLTHEIRTDVGARFDRFGGGDLALSPRGQLDWRTTSWRANVAAGAYRRAARDADALLHDLHPERTTQVSATVGTLGPRGGLTVATYYQDLSRLVVRDAFGDLRNTGTGYGYGVELTALGTRGPWSGGLTLGLGRSLRRDSQRGAERPAALDQPLRAHVFAVYAQKRWSASARASVVSGLPVTPVQRAIYDADLDWYAPIFDRPNSDRLPARVELAARLDRSFGRGHMHATFDLLVAHGAIAYLYSRDYTERRSVTLPVVPFIGVRGPL